MISLEIRKVPTNWEHPRFCGQSREKFGLPVNGKLPLKNNYEKHSKQWTKDFILWATESHPDQKACVHAKKYRYYWEWAGFPPDEEEYMPKIESEFCAYQLYETVSFGTPLTACFRDIMDLKKYMNNLTKYNALHYPCYPYIRYPYSSDQNQGYDYRELTLSQERIECLFDIFLKQEVNDE